MKGSVKRARLRELEERITGLKSAPEEDGTQNAEASDVHEQFLAKFANQNQSIQAKRGLKASAKN